MQLERSAGKLKYFNRISQDKPRYCGRQDHAGWAGIVRTVPLHLSIIFPMAKSTDRIHCREDDFPSTSVSRVILAE